MNTINKTHAGTEEKIPKFNKKLHTGLAQPLENGIEYIDELFGTLIDLYSYEIPREKIFQIYSKKTGVEPQEIIKKYKGTIDSVLEQIKKPQKQVSNIGIIGDVDHSKSSKSQEILSEHLLKNSK